ncbi:MAG: DinB family protein [Acidobacteria bacterium]|nr:DinB family protein [Acidobacteriota bacterium]
MQVVAELAGQLRKAHEGGAWHGPSLFEALAETSAREAGARPLRGAHSVWEIVLHIAAWDDLCVRRLEGHPADVPEEGDWPPVAETTQEAWERALAKVNGAQERLLRAVAALPDSRLQEKVVGKDYSVGFMLFGVLQHNVYHTGQIALLRKAQT